VAEVSRRTVLTGALLGGIFAITGETAEAQDDNALKARLRNFVTREVVMNPRAEKGTYAAKPRPYQRKQQASAKPTRPVRRRWVAAAPGQVKMNLGSRPQTFSQRGIRRDPVFSPERLSGLASKRASVLDSKEIPVSNGVRLWDGVDEEPHDEWDYNLLVFAADQLISQGRIADAIRVLELAQRHSEDASSADEYLRGLGPATTAPESHAYFEIRSNQDYNAVAFEGERIDTNAACGFVIPAGLYQVVVQDNLVRGQFTHTFRIHPGVAVARCFDFDTRTAWDLWLG
jgi:hypothetical protein